MGAALKRGRAGYGSRDGRMVELPTGEVIERRRGGAGVLATLLIDASGLRTTGYLRVERAAHGGFVGQIGIIEGRPAFALADGELESLRTGLEAYEATDTASSFDDARISTHTGVDIDLILELHPYARLLESDLAGADGEEWWAKGVHGGLNEPPSRIGGWARIRSEFELSAEASDHNGDSPDSEKDEEQPLTVVGKSSKLDSGPVRPDDAEHRLDDSLAGDTSAPTLDFGTAWSIDGNDPSTTLAMARGLALRGAPLLVISRIPPERIRSDHGIPEAVIRWLSETPGDADGIDPHLEIVLREVEEFLFANARAVCVLDGLEFLTGLHGFDRVMGFVHDIADMVAATDDMLFCPVDLLAWEPKQRALLTGDLYPIPAEFAERWATRPELMEGHPFLEDDPPESSLPTLTSHGVVVEPSESNLPSFEHDVTPMPLQGDSGPSRFSISGLISSIKEEERMASEGSAEGETIAGSDFDNGSEESAGIATEDGPQEEADSSLPAWATAPSPNMMDDPTFGALSKNPIPSDVTVEETSEPVEEGAVGAGEVDVSVSTSESDGDESESVVEDSGEDEVHEEPPVRMRDPTIDFKQKGRGIRRINRESDARLSGFGLRRAVEQAGEAPSMESTPIPSCSDGGLAAAEAIGNDLPELGDSVRTPLDATGTTWAAANARDVADEIPFRQSETVRMAIRAHPTSDASGRVPPVVSDNPMATQRAAVDQRRVKRVKTFVRLEGSAHEEDEVNVYERIGVLVDAGIDVSDLMALLEIDRKAALTRLESMEGER